MIDQNLYTGSLWRIGYCIVYRHVNEFSRNSNKGNYWTCFGKRMVDILNGFDSWHWVKCQAVVAWETAALGLGIGSNYFRYWNWRYAKVFILFCVQPCDMLSDSPHGAAQSEHFSNLWSLYNRREQTNITTTVHEALTNINTNQHE